MEMGVNGKAVFFIFKLVFLAAISSPDLWADPRRLPSITVPIDQVLPTQPFINQKILRDKFITGPTGIKLFYIGKFNGKDYYGIWDGHHSVYGPNHKEITGFLLPRGGMDEPLYVGAQSRALDMLAKTPLGKPTLPNIVAEFPPNPNEFFSPREGRPPNLCEAMARRPTTPAALIAIDCDAPRGISGGLRRTRPRTSCQAGARGVGVNILANVAIGAIDDFSSYQYLNSRIDEFNDVLAQLEEAGLLTEDLQQSINIQLKEIANYRPDWILYTLDCIGFAGDPAAEQKGHQLYGLIGDLKRIIQNNAQKRREAQPIKPYPYLAPWRGGSAPVY